MRPVLWLAAVLVLTGCEAPVTLFTDEAFRTAAPEIVDAWQGLAPWRSAGLGSLVGGVSTLRTALAHFEGEALIGVAVTAEEARQLVHDFPKVQLVFVGPGFFSSELASITIRRADAWALVARQAARAGSAVAFFPLDAVPSEIDAFVKAWNEGGGGPMTTAVGARADLPAPLPSQAFFWTGQESDAFATALPAAVAVHGNPGLRRTPGAPGLTWALRRQDLGDFLWKATHPAHQGAQFLPLETISASR